MPRKDVYSYTEGSACCQQQVAGKDHTSQQSVLTDFMKQSFNARNSFWHCTFSTYTIMATEYRAHHEAGADGVVRQ